MFGDKFAIFEGFLGEGGISKGISHCMVHDGDQGGLSSFRDLSTGCSSSKPCKFK